MNLPDSFYIALCMTILLVGAVYWVWTQIQYVQRKVNVLENIVYELKTLCSARGEDAGGPISPTTYPPAPPSVLGEDEDLLHETLRAEVTHVENNGTMGRNDVPYATIEEEKPFVANTAAPVELAAMPEEEPVFQQQEDAGQQQEQQQNAAQEETPIYDMSHFVNEVPTTAEDLQPGGVGSGVVAPPLQSSLEGMTLKELRRLALQKGISGASDMKKRDLVDAIRAVPIDSFLE